MINFDVTRYQVLLEVLQAISTRRDLPSLFKDLKHHLQAVVPYDVIIILLYDAERDVMQEYLLESYVTGGLNMPSELPAAETLGGWVCNTREPIFVADVAHEPRFQMTNQLVTANGVKSYCLLPLASAGEYIGVLGFASLRESVYAPEDRDFLMLVARHVGVALDNALNFETALSAQQQLKSERDQSQLLLEINNAVVSALDLRELLSNS